MGNMYQPKQPMQQPLQYQQPQYPKMKQGDPKRNGTAVAGFILSLVGFLLCAGKFPIVLAIAGLILSILSVKSQKKGLATAGIVLGILGIIMALAFIGGMKDSPVNETISSSLNTQSTILSSSDLQEKSNYSSEITSEITSSEEHSSEEEKAENDLVSVLESIGFSKDEATIQADKFISVGITEMSDVMSTNSEGDIDHLQGFIANAQGDKRFNFTVENRDIFYISYYDTDLYDSSKGGVLAQFDSVYVPESKVDAGTAAVLQVNTEDVIKRVLKSPSTAKFPWIDGWAINRKDNEYVVSGYVDAQNSFGAELRSYFTVYWEVNDDTGKAKVVRLIFDGEEMKIAG